MDLTIRDWMVVIGVLLITAVLLDAWRRVRSDRHSRVRMKLAEAGETGSGRDTDIGWLKELPNGGARVIERGDLLRAAGLERSSASTADGPEREQKSLERKRMSPEHDRSIDATDSGSSSPEQPEQVSSDEVELLTGMSSTSDDDDLGNIDWLDGMGAGDAPTPEPEAPRLPRDIDPEVFMLNVVARKSDGFRGGDILHILLACDLRLGDMNFFHRHEFEAGRGAIQFSVANMMQPGVFDIDNMADMNTPGLVFFLTLPGPEDMMKAFDYMLETAQAVSRNLGGDVLDESRSVLTRQTLDHCRQQIRELERRMLAKAR